ncbi:interleukin-13 receptor subunit alpha-1-like isoform X2 [Elgaria multicarinata webbii]|uniref:interleukin-13 receptor subunit alpha-1-like isoform X2 n=1 Tax=Elgaria multicarinata webbii TaxID=159646 RepID=UPI002FCCF71E
MGTLPPPPLLAVVVALAGAAVAGALFVMPTLSNLSYTFNERRCLLNVTWNPVKVVNDTCDLEYESVVSPSRDWSYPEWHRNHFHTLQVALSKIVFGVRTSCSEKLKGGEKWINISLPQNGTAGTGAINFNCIWHNWQHVVCSWQRGKNAADNTFYNMSYWYDGLKEEKPCTNYTRERDSFRCAFNLDSKLSVSLSIYIQGNSRDIQPVCIVNKSSKDGLPIKLDPPSIVNITKTSDGVFLKWTLSTFAGVCYEVEINKNISNKEQYKDMNNTTLSLKPNAYHTFRVRSILNKGCTEKQNLWSDWSNEMELAILTLIFVVCLKRIKLRILPTIPEPGKFLKRMFEEQSEDLSKPSTEEPMKDEQTDVLIFLNPPKTEN